MPLDWRSSERGKDEARWVFLFFSEETQSSKAVKVCPNLSIVSPVPRALPRMGTDSVKGLAGSARPRVHERFLYFSVFAKQEATKEDRLREQTGGTQHSFAEGKKKRKGRAGCTAYPCPV